MSPKLHAGGEVDSFCTKCRLVLNHRIIAMVGSAPKKVECSTCNSHHNYRAYAPGEKPVSTAGGARASTAGAAPRAPRVSGHMRAAAAEREREQTWEKAIAGRAVTDFRVYRVSLAFQAGDLVRHTKFGDGVVARVIDPSKVEILFKDGSKTLAQGMTD